MKHEAFGKCYLLVHDGACHLSDLRQTELAGVQQHGFPAQADLDLEGNALRPREGARRSDHRRHAHMNPLVSTHNHAWSLNSDQIGLNDRVHTPVAQTEAKLQISKDVQRLNRRKRRISSKNAGTITQRVIWTLRGDDDDGDIDVRYV